MEALTFRYSMPGFAFARISSRLSPRAYLGFGGPTRLEQIPEPALLGDDWTIVRDFNYLEVPPNLRAVQGDRANNCIRPPDGTSHPN